MYAFSLRSNLLFLELLNYVIKELSGRLSIGEHEFNATNEFIHLSICVDAPVHIDTVLDTKRERKIEYQPLSHPM